MCSVATGVGVGWGGGNKDDSVHDQFELRFKPTIYLFSTTDHIDTAQSSVVFLPPPRLIHLSVYRGHD